MFNFEKLDIWHAAIDFADLIYDLSRTFPDEERFGLTSQIRRAATSISSNIAEGSSRTSRVDFARIATGSLFGVVTQAVVSHRRGWFNDLKFKAVYAAAEKQSRMLSGLRNSLTNA